MTRKTDSDGKLHCDDGPAVTETCGSFVWYRNGVIHRDDGAAVKLVFKDGRIEEQYWINGEQVA